MKKVLSIDIGGTEIKVGKVLEDGTVYEKNSYKTIENNLLLKDRFLQILKELVTDDIDGIAVSTAGQVDCKSGHVIEAVGDSFKGWKSTNIKKLIMDEFKLNASVDNDANCAVIAEGFNGAAKGKEDYILITLGTGIGGGIVVNGKILRGFSGIAGEVGHITIDKGYEKCNCGNVGCWEMQASTKALISTIEAKTENNNINGKYVFKLLSEGDEEITCIYKEWIDNISLGLVNLIHLFNPEMIIIGGGVSKQEELLMNPIRESVNRSAMKSFTKDLKIVSAVHHNDAALIGAAINYFKEYK